LLPKVLSELRIVLQTPKNQSAVGPPVGEIGSGGKAGNGRTPQHPQDAFSTNFDG
jgi:hypothetical protein